MRSKRLCAHHEDARVDLEASRRILARFSQGNDLFPADPLSELAESVMNSTTLPLHAAERVAKDRV
jgi:hypothetical protein